MSYIDPIIKKYTDLIKAKNGTIKTYYQGEPLRIANSLLPCCIISKIATNAGPQSNVEDRHDVALRITVITDVRQDLSTEESNAKIVEGVSTLYDIMEGRDSAYILKDTSILDILRTNDAVDPANQLYTDIETLTRVDYGLTLRERAPEMWTVEARIDFTASFIQVR